MKRYKFYIVFVSCVFLSFLSGTLPAGASDKLFTVVIDAGHGGNDPGAIGRRGREKNINLSVALKDKADDLTEAVFAVAVLGFAEIEKSNPKNVSVLNIRR